MSSSNAPCNNIPEDELLVRPSSLACLECRRKHLKCDGITPTCARCASRELSCNYTPSRRGYRRWTKRSAPEAESPRSRTSPYCPSEPSSRISAGTSALDGSSGLASVDPNSPLTRSTGQTMPCSSVINPTSSAQPSLVALPQELDAEKNRSLSSSWTDDELLVSLYYLNFHPAHPILLPRSMYWKRGYPRPLKAVVEFIGSHFSPGLSSDALREATAKELERSDHASPEMVQAYILYAISLFGRNETEEGQRALSRAIKIAIEIGMHRRDFARRYASQPIEEESLRRTWHELYVADGCIAASQRKSSFETNTVYSDVLLPCEEAMYEEGICLLNPPSKKDFENRVFADDEMTFSSFCYLIEAVRILGRALSITGAHGVHRDQVQGIDNALAAFMHHLPPSKSDSEMVNTYGELDEIMFQAHTVIQYATILLHFPRGDLVSPVPSTTDVPGSNGANCLCSCTRQHIHSIKAIDASKILSVIAALRTPAQKHSPFFIYPLALGAIVQLSVSMSHSRRSNHCLEQHRDRVTLILGVLKSLSRYWSIGEIVLRALKKVAFTVFKVPGNEASNEISQVTTIDSGIDQPSTMAVDDPWLDGINGLDIRDLQNLMGFDINAFCL